MKLEANTAILERAAHTGMADVDDLFALGDAYFAEGRHQDLLDLCDRMAKMPLSNLDLATTFSYKGVTHVCLCNWMQATEAFVQALELLEDEPESREEVISLKGLNYYDLSLYCLDQDQAGQYGEQALKYLTQLTRQFPDYPHMSKVYAHMADIHHTNGEMDQALVHYGMFLESCEVMEDKVWALSGMAAVYGSMDQPDKALELYEEALDISDTHSLMSKIYYDMGEMHYKFDRLEEAKAAMESALEFMSQDPVLGQNPEYEISILWRLGTIAYDQQDDETMLDLFGRVLEAIDHRHAYYADINLRLGHYHGGRCDYSEASSHYNQVLLTPAASAEETVIARDCLAEIPLIRKARIQ